MQNPGLTFTSPRQGMQICSQVQICKPIRHNRRAVLGRCTVRALWDTGAVTSGISRRIATKLGLKVRERAILATAAGDVQTYKDLVLLDIFIDNRLLPVKAVVVDAVPGEGNDFLIGMDVMQCGQLIVDTDHERNCFEIRFHPYADLFQPIESILPGLTANRIVDL